MSRAGEAFTDAIGAIGLVGFIVSIGLLLWVMAGAQ